MDSTFAFSGDSDGTSPTDSATGDAISDNNKPPESATEGVACGILT
jgi:hypothetical protein